MISNYKLSVEHFAVISEELAKCMAGGGREGTWKLDSCAPVYPIQSRNSIQGRVQYMLLSVSTRLNPNHSASKFAIKG